MRTIGVSGPVRANSGVGVIQRRIHPRLARRAHLVESGSRDLPGPLGAARGLLLGLLPPARTPGGYFATVSPLPFLTPRPLVYVVHDLRWVREGGVLKKLYRRWDLARAVRRSSSLLCVSEQTRRELIENFPQAAAKARAVWLGPGLVEDDGWSEGVPGRLLLVGGAVRKRNELAARLIPHLPPGTITSALCIGVSEDAAQAARDALGPDRVEVRGRVDDDEMRRAFADAQFYVHLGTDEGFGLPFVEALKSGTTVVAVDQPLTREVLGDAAVLLPHVSDERVLAEAWASAVHPTAEVRRARAARFSWNHLEDAVWEGLGAGPVGHG